ncbi:hypothetical protein [Actinopolyspora biskrensis]|nr:hypothetical protein [Actinopolyspora biskrensis]
MPASARRERPSAAPTRRSATPGGQQRLDQEPFGIDDIGRVLAGQLR